MKVNTRTLFFLITIIFSDFALAKGESSLQVPISIPLSSLQNLANQHMPRSIPINQPSQICIPKKMGKTKVSYPRCTKGNGWIPVPKCGKAYKWVSTYISPDISCKINGRVSRVGNIKVTGSSNNLKIDMSVDAVVTAKSIGGVVKSQTGRARAKVSTIVGLDMRPDWTPALNVNPSYRWDKRPTIRLFKIIPVTFAGKVDPEIRKAVNQLQKNKTGLLRAINLKARLEPIWRKIQEPLLVNAHPQVYSVFSPNKVSFSGFKIEGGHLKTSLGISGKTSVAFGPRPKSKLRPLPSLTRGKISNSGFNVNLATYVNYNSLLDFARKSYPKGIVFNLNEKHAKGVVKITKPVIKAWKKGVSISAIIDYDNRSKFVKFIDRFNWLSAKGRVTFNAELDVSNNNLHVKTVGYDAATNNGLANSLVKLARLEIVKKKVASLLRYNFSKDIAKAKNFANKKYGEINLPHGLSVRSNLSSISASSLRFDQNGVGVDVMLSGQVLVR